MQAPYPRHLLHRSFFPRSLGKFIAVSAPFLISACSVSDWPGPGSDYSQTPQDGGYEYHTSAHFGGWSNNAFGEGSTLVPTVKTHPPLQGTKVCILELDDAQCAVSDANGRFDLWGLPISDMLSASLSLPGYHSLLIPLATDMDTANHPALELPSLVLQDVVYSQLGIDNDVTKGSMNFFIVKGELEENPDDGHAEFNSKIEQVGIRYRRILQLNGEETMGEWSDPRGWQTKQDIVYLNNAESPSKTQKSTGKSGLALALNLEPGIYEIQAEDTGAEGLNYQDSDRHWRCQAIAGSPARFDSVDGVHYARTRVVAGHLSDVRMRCFKERYQDGEWQVLDDNEW